MGKREKLFAPLPQEQERKKKRGGSARLPFHCCALTFTPFTTPVMVVHGNRASLYELSQILPYLKNSGKDPVSGKPLVKDDLIPVNFSKNSEGKYHCPVSFKVFNDSSHIVVIRSSGNVYSYDVVNNLNLKPKKWLDPLTNASYSGPEEVIHLQDPNNIYSLNRFSHVVEEKKPTASSSSASSNIRLSGIAERILKRQQEEEAKRKASANQGKGLISEEGEDAIVETTNHTSGMCAASFTSTSISPVTSNQLAPASAEERDANRWKRIKKLKKKGYAQIRTNLGDLNVELHCDLTPRTCENFILLAKAGKYEKTTFHRLIPKFMVQGGKCGDSCYGKPFDDEFVSSLQHSKRGILSMANKGPNTNSTQFFITFGPCHHLDNKHSVFGRLVGGFETLDKIEDVSTNKKDEPLEELMIQHVAVFVDPVAEEKAQFLQTHSSASGTGAKESKQGKKVETTKKQNPKQPEMVVMRKAPQFKNFDAW